MNIDEACALLDIKNPYMESFARSLEMMERTYLTIEKKDANLADVVSKFANRRLYPISDKKLGLVFGVDGGHDFLREELFLYHYRAEDPSWELPYVDPFEAQDRYIREGYGWYISSMRPSIIVTGLKYRPDRFDKDLFLRYEVVRIVDD